MYMEAWMPVVGVGFWEAGFCLVTRRRHCSTARAISTHTHTTERRLGLVALPKRTPCVALLESCISTSHHAPRTFTISSLLLYSSLSLSGSNSPPNNFEDDAPHIPHPLLLPHQPHLLVPHRLPGILHRNLAHRARGLSPRVHGREQARSREVAGDLQCA
jgi:hypothetical protein